MLSDYDYIAIFDADFKPEPDFLVIPTSCSIVVGHAAGCSACMTLC